MDYELRQDASIMIHVCQAYIIQPQGKNEKKINLPQVTVWCEFDKILKF